MSNFTADGEGTTRLGADTRFGYVANRDGTVEPFGPGIVSAPCTPKEAQRLVIEASGIATSPTSTVSLCGTASMEG